MAAGNETLASLETVLKTKYDQKKINLIAYEDDYVLSTIAKDTKFGGNNSRVTLQYGAPQGGSIDITEALANQTSSEFAGFLLTRARDYHVCTIDSEAMLAGEGEENTVLNALDVAMDGGMRMIKRSLEIGVYGDGTGTRGIIKSTTTLTTAVAELKDETSVVNFEVGMKVYFANPTGPALRDGGAFLTVTAVDRNTGKVTFDAALNTITGIALGDLMVRKGDFNKHIKGLAAWLPLVDPTPGESFFGVDRSVDRTRLAGVFYDGAGGDKADTLQRALIRLSREGGKDKKRVGVVNLTDLGEIAITLGSKAQYRPADNSKGDIGFDSLDIATPRGVFRLYGSLMVPSGEFYILQTDTWVLKSIKGAPHIVDDDGRTLLRSATSDAVSWRLRYYAQLGCNAPGWNLHGKF
jgi:hypothetical protein